MMALSRPRAAARRSGGSLGPAHGSVATQMGGVSLQQRDVVHLERMAWAVVPFEADDPLERTVETLLDAALDNARRGVPSGQSIARVVSTRPGQTVPA